MEDSSYWLIADGSLGPSIFILLEENNPKPLAFFSEENFRSASSKTPEVFSKVACYFKENALDISKLSLILGFGPGSLTSIKVFLTSALTFAKIYKLKFYRCNSLLIWSYLIQKEAKDFNILSYAGRSEYYVYDHKETYLINEDKLNQLGPALLIEGSNMKSRAIEIKKFDPKDLSFNNILHNYLLNSSEKSNFWDLKINYFKGLNQLY